MRKVLFVQRMIPDYRIPFFVALQEKLKKRSIDFYVTTGESLSKDCLNDAAESYPWLMRHKNYYLFKTIHIHTIKNLRSYDLVIVMQENSHLINYWLLARRRLATGPLIAFYGHGKNLNTQGNRIREYLKSKLANLPDWWFAYTALSERIVVAGGYSKEKITTVNNAIDDAGLKKICDEKSGQDKTKLRSTLGLDDNSKIGIYCGRLIEIKVSYLLEAAKLIREKDKRFEIIIIGTGPLSEKIRSYSEQYEWAHYLGPLYGADRAEYFSIADFFLMPGMVGLAILDAFAAGMPIVTADCKVHSPEIEYLEPNINGYITLDGVDAYANKILELLKDDVSLSAMKSNARRSLEQYSISLMVENFANGIEKALELKNSGNDGRVL